MEPEAKPDHVSFRKRFLFLALAAVMVMAACFPGTLVQPYLFPLGFLGFFNSNAANEPPSVVMLTVGWVFYLVITICGLSQKRKAKFFLVYGILILFLILNCVGCRIEMAHLRIQM